VVEQLIRNQQAIGSTPIAGSSLTASQMSHRTGHRERAESASAADLMRSLGSAGAAYLEASLSNPDLNEEHVALIARNRAATEAILKRIGADPRWARAYEVKAGLVRNPHTPRPLAMNMAKFLFWRDLALVADDFFVAPPVRKLCERILIERLPEMSLGEKIALARIAGRSLHHRLLDIPELPVLQALLWNGRMTEQDVTAFADDPNTPSRALEATGRHPRWRGSYAIRLALARNGHTPLAVALGILTSLMERDIRSLAAFQSTPLILKLACERVLNDPAWRSRQDTSGEDGAP
jgi:hypothetical protein